MASSRSKHSIFPLGEEACSLLSLMVVGRDGPIRTSIAASPRGFRVKIGPAVGSAQTIKAAVEAAHLRLKALCAEHP